MIGAKSIYNIKVQKAIRTLETADFDASEIAELLDLKTIEVQSFLRSKKTMKDVM
jgi:hypothetical protein